MKLNALIVDVNTEKKLFVNHFVECIAMPNTEQSKKKVRKEKRIIYIYIYIFHMAMYSQCNMWQKDILGQLAISIESLWQLSCVRVYLKIEML